MLDSESDIWGPMGSRGGKDTVRIGGPAEGWTVAETSDLR